jgi:hypothetical protein
MSLPTSRAFTQTSQYTNLTKYKPHKIQTTQTFHQSEYIMKLNLLLLSAAAMVNAAKDSATDTVPLGKVELGTAGNFVILAKSGISTVPSSEITGDIAVSPIASGAITGFNLAMDVSNTFATDDSSQINDVTGSGSVYAPDYTDPTASVLTTAVSDMETAYTDAAARLTTDAAYSNFGAEDTGEMGGRTLVPGVYTFDRDALISADVYFTGKEEDVFIIQTSGSVKQASSTSVFVTGGALAENIFWSVAQEVIVGTGAHLEGVLLVKTGATFNTGSSLNGRILAQTAVTLQMATITQKPEATK